MAKYSKGRIEEIREHLAELTRRRVPVGLFDFIHEFADDAAEHLEQMLGSSPDEEEQEEQSGDSTADPQGKKPRKKPGRREFQRGVVSYGADGRLVVHKTGHQGSGVLSSMAAANCFIVLPEDAGPVSEGDEVEVQPFAAFV